jgi:hypothetical protein
MKDVIGRSLGGVLDTESSPDSDKEQERLERELENLDAQLGKLAEKEENARRQQLVERLFETYPNLEKDLRKIRLQAISDFRKSPETYADTLDVKSETEIVDACRATMKLAELQRKKIEIEVRLGVLYGVDIKLSDPGTSDTKDKSNTKDESKSEGPPPTFRVNGSGPGVVMRSYVRPRKGLTKLYRFPDGVTGFVYKVDFDKFPAPRYVPKRLPNGYEYRDWVEPFRVELLTAPHAASMTDLRLSRTQMKALKLVLRDSKPEGNPYDYWKEFVDPAVVQAFESKARHPDDEDAKQDEPDQNEEEAGGETERS